LSPSGPSTYQVRVEGHLDDHWSSLLGNLTITRESDGTSTLTGPVADQAELHSVFASLRDIGATILSLGVTDPAPHGARGMDGCATPGGGGERIPGDHREPPVLGSGPWAGGTI
jgi:hypothetical protein